MVVICEVSPSRLHVYKTRQWICCLYAFIIFYLLIKNVYLEEQNTLSKSRNHIRMIDYQPCGKFENKMKMNLLNVKVINGLTEIGKIFALNLGN